MFIYLKDTTYDYNKSQTTIIMDGTKGREKQGPDYWIWVVVVVFICCILVAIAVFIYIRKKESEGNGEDNQVF